MISFFFLVDHVQDHHILHEDAVVHQHIHQYEEVFHDPVLTPGQTTKTKKKSWLRVLLKVLQLKIHLSYFD